MTCETTNLFYPNPQSGISFNMQIDTGDVFSLTDFNTCTVVHLTAGTMVTKIWLHVPFKKSVNYILMQPTLCRYIIGSGGILFGNNVIPNPVYPNNFVYGSLSFKVDYKLNIACDGMAGIAEKADDLWNMYSHMFEPNAKPGMQMHTVHEHKNYELQSTNPYDARNWREIPKITNGDYDLPIIDENNPIEIQETGNYVFIPFKTNNYNWKYNPSGISSCEHKNGHNEVKFNVTVQDDAFHSHTESWYKNALFMENEDCDGYIWEKKHVPNDYIIFYPFYGPGWWRIYPQDKYVLSDWGLNKILGINDARNSLYRVGDYLVFLFQDNNDVVWRVSKDSKKWKETKTKGNIPRWLYMSTTFTTSNSEPFGTYIDSDGKFCTFEITEDGVVEVTETGRTNEGITVWVCVGGYILFTYNNDIKPHKTVYQMSPKGYRQLSIETNWTGTITWRTCDQYQLAIGNYTNPYVRFVAYSTDGFATYTEITSLNEIQNYGDNWSVVYFDGCFYSTVRRADAVIPNKYYWDTRQIINGGQVWQDILRSYTVEFCGWHTGEPRQGVVPHTGHFMTINKTFPGFSSGVSMNGGPFYFKNGKLQSQFGWALHIFTDYTNTNYCAVIGNCDPARDTPKYCVPPLDDCDGSFVFMSSSNKYAYLVDPNNDTWNLPW